MYRPPHFDETEPEAPRALIRAHPLATLVTINGGQPKAGHLPMLLDADNGGVLRGHLARANDQWRYIDPGIDALAIFTGAEGYVSPSWYATKAETGKVVPTWNYAAVHVRGPLRVIEDRDWLARFLRRLTERHEAGGDAPWRVDDAPAGFIAAQMRGIVGIEISVRSIEGKWKMSQNRPERDRRGVVAGLDRIGTEAAAALARDVARCGGLD